MDFTVNNSIIIIEAAGIIISSLLLSLTAIKLKLPDLIMK